MFQIYFLNFNYLLCIIHFIKFLKLLSCFYKTIPKHFSDQNFHDALLLFKPVCLTRDRGWSLLAPDRN